MKFLFDNFSAIKLIFGVIISGFLESNALESLNTLARYRYSVYYGIRFPLEEIPYSQDVVSYGRRRSDAEPNIPNASTDLVTSSPLENQEQTNFFFAQTTDKNSLKIDRIKAELSQESAYPITNSDFSDDSHN